jgi:zinc transport system substrate-binding protein
MARRGYVFLLYVVLCVFLISVTACAPQKINGKQLKVSVSFDAMAEFAKAVGKDKVEVTTIIPVGTEPHDFEPKAQDMASLGKAALFVYNGLGMEAWAEKAISASGNKSLVAVCASEGAEGIVNEDPKEAAEHGQYDPHIWLSLSGAQLAAKNIAAALSKVDPENETYYNKNRDDFTKELEGLRAEYETKFRGTKRRDFVTGHAAFAYFCRDFGLKQNSVEDVFAEGEPSAKGLRELVDYCRAKRIKTIFAEEMVSPEVSNTLAEEVGAKVETIATMESAEGGKTYIERTKENLDKIYASLSD